MIRFTARGLHWRIRTRNTFDDVRAAERLAAAIQIIMAALGNDDLVLVETTVEVRVRTVRPRQHGAVVIAPRKQLDMHRTVHIGGRQLLPVTWDHIAWISRQLPVRSSG